jgi:hypothetical protein
MKLLPGLSFSLSRAIGLTAMKQRTSRRIGVPLSRSGRERWLGRLLLSLLGGRRS